MNKFFALSFCLFLYISAYAQETTEKPIFPKSYLSIGVAQMHSKLKAGNNTQHKDVITDYQPSFKIALGSQNTPYWRVEGFYQLRNSIKETNNLGGIPYSAEVKMQDAGVNFFFTVNPYAQGARLFIGAGLWATNIRPKLSILNVPMKGFKNEWFLTPMGFIGIEWPDEAGNVAMDITFFYGRTLIDTSYRLSYMSYSTRIKLDHITTCGVALNFRFGLP